MNRAEHLAWCKQRALEYLERGDLVNAVTSMISDLTKHPDTNNPILAPLLMVGAMSARDNDARGVRRWIEGFN